MNSKILVLGDALEDVFYVCDKPTRFSAEVDIPIHDVKEVKLFPGGAANIVRNLENLGFECEFLYGVNANIGIPQKCRVFANNQQVARFDLNDRVDPIWKEFLDPHLTHSYKAVVVADYGKGSIDRLVRENVINYCQKFVCPLFINTKDSPMLWWTMPNSSTTAFCNYKEWSQFEEQYNVMHNVVRTEGAEGVSLMSKGQLIKHLPALAPRCIDVNGAGDVFMATYIARSIGTNLVAEHKPSALQFASVAAAVAIQRPYTSYIEFQEQKEAWHEYNSSKTTTSK